MAIELVKPTEKDIPELSRIMFGAFDDIARRHGFQSDVPTPEIATMAMTSFVTRPDIYGVMAKRDGKIVGHNFLQISDPVSGVGPICVDCAVQAKGVGKQLMQNVIDHALKNHGPQVRLVQEAFNMRSLSLYAALGFTVRQPLTLVTFESAKQDDPTVRPLKPDDVPAADALCQQTQKVTRKNELAGMIQHGPSFGATPFGRFKNGKLVAFMVPGFFGFGAAESVDDLLDVQQAAARSLPQPSHRFLLPTRQGELFTAALKRGFRSEKVLQLMTMGPYEEPTGTWYPSIAY